MGLKDNNKQKQVNKNSTFIQSLSHAINGLCDLFLEERNFRFHLIFSAIVIILGFLCRIHIRQWLWILLAIFIVIIAEVVNTLIENIVDLIVGYKYDLLAKRIKDIAAGCVLITSLVAVIIGLLIFIPIFI